MNYKRQADWPKVTPRDTIADMTAVSIGKDGYIYTLDRGGRSWKDRNAPTTLSSPVIKQWSAEGEQLAAFGSGLFVMPHGLCVDPDGAFWVADVGRHQVLKLDTTGTVLLVLGQERRPGSSADCFSLPTGVVVADNGCIFVTDGYGNARVMKFSADGTFIHQWGKRGSANGEFKLPHSVALDPVGNVVVADRENARVQMFDCAGRHLATWDNRELGKPFSVAASMTHLFIADCGFPNDRRAGLVIINRTSNEIVRFGEFGTAAGEMLGPHDIDWAADGSIYIADAAARLHKFRREE
ncbi:MAG: hypothetical protein GXP16_07840 [Gammaproteobacteria bacterium]|nr:hypothetical protein [Gammaproteobacteria bacterium]